MKTVEKKCKQTLTVKIINYGRECLNWYSISYQNRDCHDDSEI